MINYRDVLRMRSQGFNKTEIASAAHCSRDVVRDVLKRADSAGLKWPVSEDMTNDMLATILYPERAMKANEYLVPDYEYIHKQLAIKGVNLTLLWTEYCIRAKELGKRAYMTTQFNDNYRKWAAVNKATLRISHKPGDVMQVDWAGSTLHLYDRETCEVKDVYLFAGVLPCSLYVYAEPFLNMRIENWITAHIHAYEYFGGVTRLLVPDNTKTASIKNTVYELILNRNFADFADYYEVAVVQARVRHPKDKALAEGSVKNVTTWIIGALRNEKFYSFEDIRTAVAEKLEALNNRPFTNGRKGSRKESYEQEEKPFMRPLPKEPYDPAVWSTAKIHTDYLISDGKNKYTVPYTLIGQTVDIRLTKNLVEVYQNGSRVAVHPRLETAQKEPIRNMNHLPDHHKKYLNYDPEAFRLWGKNIGPSTEKVVNYFLDTPLLQKTQQPEQGLKQCFSMLKLADKYGAARLENACEKLMAVTGEPSIRNISSLLKNRQDKTVSNSKQVNERDSGTRGIIRGEGYYSNRRKGDD